MENGEVGQDMSHVTEPVDLVLKCAGVCAITLNQNTMVFIVQDLFLLLYCYYNFHISTQKNIRNLVGVTCVILQKYRSAFKMRSGKRQKKK